MRMALSVVAASFMTSAETENCSWRSRSCPFPYRAGILPEIGLNDLLVRGLQH